MSFNSTGTLNRVIRVPKQGGGGYILLNEFYTDLWKQNATANGFFCDAYMLFKQIQQYDKSVFRLYFYCSILLSNNCPCTCKTHRKTWDGALFVEIGFYAVISW